MRLKRQRTPWPTKKEHSDHMKMRKAHNPRRDAFYDREYSRRMGIITIRVKNFSEDNAARAIEQIKGTTENWSDRRKRLGLHQSTRGRAGQQSLWKE